MAQNLIRLVIVFLLTIVSDSSWAQIPNVHTSEMTAIKKLPVSALSCIYRDSEGYMWYGTVDGLCRDDGYNIHVFRSDYNTPGLMDINSVLCIAEDKKHQIWVGTHKGVYILDKQTYDMRKVDVKELQGSHVTQIVVRRRGDILISCNSCLYTLNTEGKLVSRRRLASDCSSIYEDRSGRLLFSLWSGGLYRLEDNGRTVMLHPSLLVRSMTEDSRSANYWLVGVGHDVWLYCPKAKDQEARFALQKLPADMQPSYFMQVVQDNSYHYLWLLGNSDIYVARPVAGNRLERVPADNLFTKENKIFSQIYKSGDGNLWVAAFDHFSFVIRFQGSDVTSYPIDPMLNATGFRPSIVTLCRDTGGAFWYYQEAYGLFLYDPQSGSGPVDYRRCPSVNGLPLYTIPYLVRSHRTNSVWVMTPGTMIMRLRREGLTILPDVTLDLASVSSTSGEAEVIFEDRGGNLWIGTMRGVFRYDDRRRKLERISEEIGDVSDFAQSSDGYVWCTVRNRGICRIAPSGKWQLFPQPLDFLTLDITTDGTIWTSTGEGQILAFASSDPSHYTDYTRQAGMNGDMADHVKVDRFNHLWIVTPRTIREFNPRNGAVRVYSTSDADITQHRFLPRAVYRDVESGDMFFGGIPGMVSFRTSMRLESIPRNVKTRITDVKVAGKSVLLSPDREKTSASIDIQPDEQNISIEFSTLDFNNKSHICYAYRLRGVDNDWVYLPVGKNSAEYNRLSKGDYVFEVKATDENGLWSKHVTQFTICRLPAWWETWWAYSIYAVMIITALWQVVKRYKQRVEAHNDQIIEDSVTEGKKEYLTNVSQGLATPLLTIGTIAGDLKPTDKSMEKKLGIIQDNVNRMMGMMQQEMDSQLSVTKVDERFMEKAVKTVEDNLGSERLDVNFLASEMGMSRSTFSRKLKAVAKQTPLEFIRSIKMRHAAAMLRQKTATIQDVMLAVGYNDHKTFTQVFRDTFGMSPSEYQKKGEA